MSERDFENLDQQQRAAREAVRGLVRPAADPDFRARLKDQFVAGRIPETELSRDDDQDAVLAGPARRPQGWRRSGLGWGGLAAAAVLAVAMIFGNRLPGPELLDATGTGIVTIDGRELSATDPGALGEALRPGTRIQVGQDSSVDVLYPGSFAMRLGAGTDLELPARPGRWYGRSVEAPLTYGEVSVRTGPDLAGGDLTIRTAEGRTIIHGTLVSVMRNDDVTCICLYEGSADVRTDDQDLGAVPRGMRWVLFRDGSAPQLLEIVPAHRDHMLGLDDALGDVFK